ncbi:MAG: hypothetical protein CVV51_09180 [Spirochaetae bacterium HGW-Spirochaetae-7]|jgi:phosphatidate cytidylyltransferase|nr:MAG: hypothetical protein CVV51_09180 [Spirochaetae bacterium HGW-Spirochaetae-7]
MNNFVTRVIFVGIALPVLFAIAVFMPHFNNASLSLLTLVFTVGSALELRRIVEPAGGISRDAVAVAFATLPSIAVYFSRLTMRGAGLAASWLSPVAIACLLLFMASALPVAFPKKPDAVKSSIAVIGANALYLFYPGALSTAIIVILGARNGAGQMLIWFALIVFGNDSLAWLAGVTLGKRRGIFAVSPNKSLEGLVAGMSGSIFFSFAGAFLFPSTVPRNWIALGIIGLACGSAVVTGDLFESAIKRAGSVKDSGSIIPGRGGMLDSYDSLLFAAPVFAGILGIMGMLT